MAVTEYLWKNSGLIDYVSFLIPLFVGWYEYKRTSKTLKFFVIILSITFVFAVVCYYTGLYYINNLLIYFTQYVLEFTLYSILFSRLIATRAFRLLVFIATVLLITMVVWNYKNIFQTISFDSYTPALVSLSLILYCILFFHTQLNMPQITFIYRTPWFWIVTGLLLYNAGNFLVFLFTNYLMYRNGDLVRQLWGLRDYLDAFKNILIMIGFLHIRKND